MGELLGKGGIHEIVMLREATRSIIGGGMRSGTSAASC